jgi:hypothetical protein
MMLQPHQRWATTVLRNVEKYARIHSTVKVIPKNGLDQKHINQTVSQREEMWYMAWRNEITECHLLLH